MTKTETNARRQRPMQEFLSIIDPPLPMIDKGPRAPWVYLFQRKNILKNSMVKKK
jgi:hypothetical protein